MKPFEAPGDPRSPGRKSLDAFRDMVLDDPSLQEKLLATADVDLFAALTVALGAERGLRFSADDVHEALRASRRVWLERWI